MVDATAPFAPAFPIRSLADIERLEQQAPLAQAVPVASTYALLRNSAAAFGGRCALAFLRTADPDEAPIRWSYAELLAGVHQTANLLHMLGVGPQDAVAVLLPGCLEYHLALWGGSAAGIVQPLNPLLADDKLAAMMAVARAKVLIAWGGADDAGIWAKALRLREAVPTLRTVLRVAPTGEPPAHAPALPAGIEDFEPLRRRQPDDRLVSGRHIAAGDIAAYFHTGGTTGAPKLARHSHGAQVFTAWACVQMQGLLPTDRSINGYPLFHVAGVLPGALASFAAGVEVILPTPQLFRNRQVIANYWRLVDRLRPTILSAVPTVLAALAEVPLDGADISCIRHCRTGAAVLPPELAARFEKITGLHVHESLGMTEMAGISTITPPGVVAPAGCVGWRIPYSELRIAALDAHGNATGEALPAGQVGMVQFRSPNLFSGYLAADASAQGITADGWLATGDLGHLDAEGRLHLAGRSKDLIIRSGHNIDPRVIEEALAAHPAVQMCAAVGAPDAYAGELPVAFVTLAPRARVSEEELLAFAAVRVDEAPAKPKRVTILQALPLTNVGKIYKPQLRQQAARQVAAAIAAELMAQLGLPAGAHPAIHAAGDDALCVLVDPVTAGDSAAAFHAGLQQALGRLPYKTQVLLQSLPSKEQA